MATQLHEITKNMELNNDWNLDYNHGHFHTRCSNEQLKVSGKFHCLHDKNFIHEITVSLANEHHAMTAKQYRSINVSDLYEALAHHTRHPETENSMTQSAPTKTVRRGRPTIYGPDHHARVARDYLHELAIGNKFPASTMAIKYKTPPNTVTSWITKARKLGYLTRPGANTGTAGGTAGPALIEYERDNLNQP